MTAEAHWRGLDAVDVALAREPHCRCWYDEMPCCRCGYDGPDETSCPDLVRP